MKRHLVGASAMVVASFLGATASHAQAAQQCAWEKPGWSASGDEAPRGPAAEIRLVSIGLDADGGFAVKSATRPLGQRAFAWRLDDMLETATEPDMSSKTSPLDLEFSEDTLIVFHLEPEAWDWADARRDRFFLKTHNRRGKRQVHNPFGPARLVRGRDDMMAVRYNPMQAYRGCNYSFNLGAVVRQTVGGTVMETPIIIDPIVDNSGHGGGNN